MSKFLVLFGITVCALLLSPVVGVATAETNSRTHEFLADLDRALAQGCGAFYKFMGWEKYEPPHIVCVSGADEEASRATKLMSETLKRRSL